jgi:hypothetical protein
MKILSMKYLNPVRVCDACDVMYKVLKAGKNLKHAVDFMNLFLGNSKVRELLVNIKEEINDSLMNSVKPHERMKIQYFIDFDACVGFNPWENLTVLGTLKESYRIRHSSEADAKFLEAQFPHKKAVKVYSSKDASKPINSPVKANTDSSDDSSVGKKKVFSTDTLDELSEYKGNGNSSANNSSISPLWSRILSESPLISEIRKAFSQSFSDDNSTIVQSSNQSSHNTSSSDDFNAPKIGKNIQEEKLQQSPKKLLNSLHTKITTSDEDCLKTVI